MLSIVNKTLCILLLLLVVSTAKASPIVISCTDTLGDSFFCTDTLTTISCEAIDFVGPISSKLVNPTSESLKVPVYFVDLNIATTDYVKPLPATPTAILMVLTGFLCISLIRDRKVWLTMLAGLLWASQTGVQAVPQLVLRLGERVHPRSRVVAEASQLCLKSKITRPRCDIDGTRYIGLLRYLAGIPDSKDVSHLCCKAGYFDALAQKKDKFGLPEFKITKLLSCIIHKSSSAASIAQDTVCFSPAFIFQCLSRGPPAQA